MSLATIISKILFGSKTAQAYKVSSDYYCSVSVRLPMQILYRMIERFHPVDLLLLSAVGDAFDDISSARHDYLLFGQKRGNQFLLICPYLQVRRLLLHSEAIKQMPDWKRVNLRYGWENKAAIDLANAYERYMLANMRLNDDQDDSFFRTSLNTCKHFYVHFDWDRCGEQCVRIVMSKPDRWCRSFEDAAKWSIMIKNICEYCAKNLESFGMLSGESEFHLIYDKHMWSVGMYKQTHSVFSSTYDCFVLPLVT